MPMYEFDCVDCHTTFEELVLAGSGQTEIACPACASRQVSRRLSAFAVGAASSFGSSHSASGDPAGSSCATGGCCSGGSCW